MSIYSVYPSILEGIPETHIQVDGIHGKGNCIEIFLENIIQSHVRSANTLRCLKARQSTPACTPQANLRKSSEKS